MAHQLIETFGRQTNEGKTLVQILLNNTGRARFGAVLPVTEEPKALRPLARIVVIENARCYMECKEHLRAFRILYNAFWSRNTDRATLPAIEEALVQAQDRVIEAVREAISTGWYAKACELLEGIRGRGCTNTIASEIRGLLYVVYRHYAKEELKGAEKEQMPARKGRRFSFAAIYFQNAYACALNQEEKEEMRTAAIENYLRALEIKGTVTGSIDNLGFENGIERDFCEAARLANNRATIKRLADVRKQLTGLVNRGLRITLPDLAEF